MARSLVSLTDFSQAKIDIKQIFEGFVRKLGPRIYADENRGSKYRSSMAQVQFHGEQIWDPAEKRNRTIALNEGDGEQWKKWQVQAQCYGCKREGERTYHPGTMFDESALHRTAPGE